MTKRFQNNIKKETSFSIHLKVLCCIIRYSNSWYKFTNIIWKSKCGTSGSWAHVKMCCTVRTSIKLNVGQFSFSTNIPATTALILGKVGPINYYKRKQIIGISFAYISHVTTVYKKGICSARWIIRRKCFVVELRMKTGIDFIETTTLLKNS